MREKEREIGREERERDLGMRYLKGE